VETGSVGLTAGIIDRMQNFQYMLNGYTERYYGDRQTGFRLAGLNWRGNQSAGLNRISLVRW
jgi:hypothetical protein